MTTGRVTSVAKRGSNQVATMVVCPGVTNDGIAGHSMRDQCHSCAPFWEQYPICPDCKKKLTSKLYCQTCRTHYRQPANLNLKHYAGYGAAAKSGSLLQ